MKRMLFSNGQGEGTAVPFAGASDFIGALSHEAVFVGGLRLVLNKKTSLFGAFSRELTYCGLLKIKNQKELVFLLGDSRGFFFYQFVRVLGKRHIQIRTHEDKITDMILNTNNVWVRKVYKMVAAKTAEA